VIGRLLETAGAECVARGGKAVRAAAQQRLFERLLRAPLSFLDRLPAGAAANFLRDAESGLEEGLLQIPIEMARSLGSLVPAAAAVWRRRSLPLFAVVGLMGPGLAAVSSLAALKATAAERDVRALEAARKVSAHECLHIHEMPLCSKYNNTNKQKTTSSASPCLRVDCDDDDDDDDDCSRFENAQTGGGRHRAGQPPRHGPGFQRRGV
jgi:hypothetical protein